MEFFNYEYCKQLNKHTELDKLNNSIFNIKKEIETKKQNIKNLLDAYMKYNCLTKCKIYDLKHLIIKNILNIYTNNKSITYNNSNIIKINDNIIKFSSIKYNLLEHNTINVYDFNNNCYFNKLNKNLNKILKKIKIVNYNNDIILNINMIYIHSIDFINKNDINTIIKYFDFIIFYLSRTVYKKNKQLYNLYYIALKFYMYANISNIQESYFLIYKLLNLFKLINLNNELTDFFKVKVYNTNTVISLSNNKKKILKINNSYINSIPKIQKNINSKVKLYNKLYKRIYNNPNNIYITTINRYEQNIINLNKILNIFNDKYTTLNNTIENLNLIKCPDELQKKCITTHNGDDICCICLDAIDNGVKTSCNHMFHIYCINLYIFSILNSASNDINILCPLCRKYI